ncbi:DUF493 domain-containing protein [Methylophilaceae bacterium]|nr:DUF493 domain-containing protein [Nitrosomonadales bacterium]MDA9085226.1 DUF493 domain-containing protein [Methylophilaceae bacterium]MDA9818977.1 DUF493 domain-containing protein [Methylophilaceae bacterium]MDC1281272.1 DUF493 domain-containing protein [Methylophilaceae bacterium]
MAIDPSETLIEFPCEFPIKVIGIVSEQYTDNIVRIIQKHAPNFSTDFLEIKESNQGTYISLTCNIYVTSKVQLDNLYKDLSSYPETKFVL